MLKITDLSVAYGKHQALNQVSLEVSPGEIVVILGANGAGKSSLLKSISGICEGAISGQIVHDGVELQALSSDEIVSQGIALVPEGRGIFPELNVIENLKLGAYSNEARADAQENLERVLELFPRLNERHKQRAGTMSGGEQQMVAIGRAMMSNPKILTLDEPSLGLSPLLTKELFQNLKRVKAFGLGILLVEQNARQSLAIADRGYLLENTKIVKQDSAASLLNDPEVQAVYLGGGGTTAKVKPKAASSGKAHVVNDDLPRVETAIDTPESRSADRVLGRSINDLVNLASSTSKDAYVTQSSSQMSPAPEHAAPRRSLSTDQIDLIYQDIEQAAKNALQRNRTHRKTEQKTDQPRPAQTRPKSNSEPETPVQIEVYRPPRVEIYRRQGASDQFAKEES